MATKAQKWAQERNWNKARLKGAIGALLSMAHQKSTISAEKIRITASVGFLNDTLRFWDGANKTSKKQYMDK